jgi:hypothetical protein
LDNLERAAVYSNGLLVCSLHALLLLLSEDSCPVVSKRAVFRVACNFIVKGKEEGVGGGVDMWRLRLQHGVPIVWR